MGLLGPGPGAHDIWGPTGLDRAIFVGVELSNLIKSKCKPRHLSLAMILSSSMLLTYAHKSSLGLLVVRLSTIIVSLCMILSQTVLKDFSCSRLIGLIM